MRVSVIVPARDAGTSIDAVLEAVFAQDLGGATLEVLVANDGSTDDTVARASSAGATVIDCTRSGQGGNPASARNEAAGHATGELLVFLDADCTPRPGWLQAMLARYEQGEVCIGGSLSLPPGLPLSARCDYYCGWYHMHPAMPEGAVSNHPPGNIAITREIFFACGGFETRHPIAFSHEELRWQAELQRRGHRIYFEPAMQADHWNRPGWANLHRRNYRWAYGAIESKAATGNVRWPALYRRPVLLMAAVLFSSPLQSVYIVFCWLRGGVFEPLLMFPIVLSARTAYSAGMVVGGIRWMRRSNHADGVRPRWE